MNDETPLPRVPIAAAGGLPDRRGASVTSLVKCVLDAVQQRG